MRIIAFVLGKRWATPVYSYEMIKGLSKYCDIKVILEKEVDNISQWRQLPIERLEVTTYKNHDLLSGICSFLKIITFLKIRQFINHFNPDIIYYPVLHPWKIVLDCWIPSQIPEIMTIHDPILHEGENSFLFKFFHWAALRKPKFFVLLNNTQKNYFINKHKLIDDTVCVLPLGVFSSYKESIKKLDDLSEFKDIFQLQGKYFLFIGRLLKYKGLSTLLKASKILLKNNLLMPLVIAGAGRLSEEEQDLLSFISISGKVYFYNHYLDDSSIATLVKNAYMTILPYDSATQSGIIPLSFAFGTPALASNVAGLKEQVKNNETGYIFTAKDEENLAHKMLHVWNLESCFYQNMRKQCLVYANKNWGWDSIAKDFNSFLNDKINLKFNDKPKKGALEMKAISQFSIENYAFEKLTLKQKLIIFMRKLLGTQTILNAQLFRGIIEDSAWLKYKSFAPGGMALDNAALYTLYRIMNDTKPKNILEFGLGQSSIIIHQYAAFFNAKALTIEHDNDWINFFTSSINNVDLNIKQHELEIINFMGFETLAYKNINEIKNGQYDFICVDGPFGSKRYSRSQIIDMADSLSEQFCIFIDDSQRKGEKETLNELIKILKHKMQAELYCRNYIGEKNQHTLVCSKHLKFLTCLR
ncbi:MAG: glycosyltransferase family 4 protein [Synergistaceae bacterium]|jgi:glycosyltransferase involved in cell wall biosynthesis/predicted O-methyltransferase YrrM|nr:glycosyltransferase family 4 protein [Synergistaceae bacterium]